MWPTQTNSTACTGTENTTPYLIVSYQLATNANTVYVFLSREQRRTVSHSLWKVDTSQNNIIVSKRWNLPVKVCSSAVAKDSYENEFVYMCLCGTSFVSFTNASDVNGTYWNSTRAGRVSVARCMALLIGSVRESWLKDILRD